MGFLDDILASRQSGRQDIAEIGLFLQAEDDRNGGISSSIIRDYKHFSKLHYEIINEETQRFTVYDVLGLDQNLREVPSRCRQSQSKNIED